ncbi:winged helix-turn-helix transcriptional regulator [Vibrio cholerae]
MSTHCQPANLQDVVRDERDTLEEEKIALLAKALAHPARVRILRILLQMDKRGECLNSDLVGELRLAQSTVSEHLRILKQAEFILSEPKPPKVCYRVNTVALAQFGDLFHHLFSPND